LPQKGIQSTKQILSKILGSKPASFLLHLKRRKQQLPKFDKKSCDKVIETIRKLLPSPKKSGITLAVENHWGLSTNPDNIVYIIEQINSPFFGTCPDFGNVLESQDRYVYLKRLLPYAKLLHAKSYSFEKNGEESSIEYKRCMNIITSLNYQGFISVEYEGRENGIEGAIQTKNLIQKYLSCAKN
jgi:sugar phosphate isomerase/epimerase